MLAQVETAGGEPRPALVVQPFGRGRTAALLVGDLWRWNLRREDHKESDLDKSWRQTVRWLVADVPQPVEVETRRASGTALPGVEIVVRARDKQFAPLDNAGVAIKVQTPDKRNIELVAESSSTAAGEYVATFAPREAGAYRATIAVTAADGSEVGSRADRLGGRARDRRVPHAGGQPRRCWSGWPRKPAARSSTPTAWTASSASLPNRKIPGRRKLDLSALAPVADVPGRDRRA